MKTVLKIFEITLLGVLTLYIYNSAQTLQSIATELRLNNEMQQCYYDPNCTVSNEM